MGDLINRSAVIELIEGCHVLEDAYCLIDYISELGTAYDVEKVIQQLEEKISSYEQCVETAIKEIDKNPQNASTFEVCSLHNNRGYLNGLKRALEIVKSGGNDVGQKGGV